MAAGTEEEEHLPAAGSGGTGTGHAVLRLQRQVVPGIQQGAQAQGGEQLTLENPQRPQFPLPWGPTRLHVVIDGTGSLLLQRRLAPVPLEGGGQRHVGDAGSRTQHGDAATQRLPRHLQGRMQIQRDLEQCVTAQGGVIGALAIIAVQRPEQRVLGVLLEPSLHQLRGNGELGPWVMAGRTGAAVACKGLGIENIQPRAVGTRAVQRHTLSRRRRGRRTGCRASQTEQPGCQDAAAHPPSCPACNLHVPNSFLHDG